MDESLGNQAGVGMSEAEQAAPMCTVARQKLAKLSDSTRKLSEAANRIVQLCEANPGLDEDLTLVFNIKLTV